MRPKVTERKSIISRTYRIGTEGEASAGKVEQALADVGVAVRDTSGEFRAFETIMKELSQEWGSLSKVTKQNVSQAMAGTYHYSRLMAMMENFGMATDATTKALNSENSALDENEKYLDSISGRLGVLRTTIEEQFAKAIDVDLIKQVIELGTQLVGTFGNLKTIMMSVLSVLAIWKGAAIVRGMISLAQAIMTTNLMLGRYTLFTGAAAKKTLHLDMVVKSFWRTLLANPIGIVITAITAYILVMDYLEQKKKEQIESSKEAIQVNKQELESIAKITQYYKDNHTKIEDDIKVKQDLIAMQDELIEKFGEEAVALDLVNGKYQDNIDKMEEFRKESLKSALSEIDATDDVRAEKYAEPSIVTYGFGRESAKIRSDLGDRNLELDEYIAKLKEIRSVLLSNNKEEMKSKYGIRSNKERGGVLKAIKEELDGINENISIQNEKEKINIELAEINAYTRKNLNNEQKEFRSLLQEKIEFKSYDQYEQQLRNIQDIVTSGDFKKVQAQFQNIDKEISNGTMTWRQYFKQADKIKDTLKDFGLEQDDINSLFEFQTGIKTVEISEEQLDKQIESTNKAYDGRKERLELLTTAMNELKESEELTVSTTEELLRLYPTLNIQTEQTGKLIEELSNIYEKVEDSAKDSFTAQIRASRAFYSDIVNNQSDAFDEIKEFYGEDFENFANLEALKTDMQNKLIKARTDETYLYLLEQKEKNADALTMEQRLILRGKQEYLNELEKTLGEGLTKVEGFEEDVADKLMFEKAAAESERLEKAFDSITSKAKTLASAITTLQDEEKLSFETKLDLISEYDELADVMDDNAALLEKLKELHSKEASAAKRALRAKLMANHEFINSVIDFNSEYFNGLSTVYGDDILNWTEYMKAKRDISKEAVEVIGKQWGEDLQKSLEDVSSQIGDVFTDGPEGVASGALASSDSMRQLERVKNLISTEIQVKDELDNKINKILEGINFEDIGFTDKQLNDKEKDTEITLVQADRYLELNDALEQVNKKLEKNKILQETAEGDSLISLLDEEIGLLKQKGTALNNLLAEQKKDRADKKQQLKDLGVTFKGENTILKILKRKEEAANAAAKARSENADKLKKEYEDFEKLSGAYGDLVSDIIPSTQNAITSIGAETADVIEKQIAEKVRVLTESFVEMDEKVEPLVKNIDKLNDRLSDLDDTEFDEKEKLLGERIDENNLLIKQYETNLVDLKSQTYDTKEETDLLNEKIEEQEDLLWDASRATIADTKALADNTDARKDHNKEIASKAIEKYINHINKKTKEQIELLKEQQDVESDLADLEIKNKSERIKTLDTVIKAQKKLNDEIDKSREKEDIEKDLAKQKKLIANLQSDRSLKVYKEGAGWIWTVDKTKIAEEQEKLKEMEKDFDKWKRDTSLETKEAEKKSLEDDVTTYQEKLGEKIEALEGSLIEMGDIIEDDENVITSWNGLMSELSKVSDEYYSEDLKKLKLHLDDMAKAYTDAGFDPTTMQGITEGKNLEFGKGTEETGKPDAGTQDTGKDDDTDTGISDIQMLRDTGMFSGNEIEDMAVDVMKENSRSWLETNNPDERDALAAQNESVGEQLNWKKGADGKWYKPDGTVAYETGGTVDYTGLAWLDGSKNRPERVLSPSQTESFDKLVDYLPSMNLDNINSTSQDVATEIYNINIDKVQTNDAKEFVDNLRKLTYNKGRGA